MTDISIRNANGTWTVRAGGAVLGESRDALELSEAGQMPRWLARKAAFCFRRMGFLTVCGKRGNAVEYRLARALRRRAAS